MDTLEGVVERITYYSEETGYTVLRLRPGGRQRPMFAPGEDDLVAVGRYCRPRSKVSGATWAQA
jgi:hypothetical protein